MNKTGSPSNGIRKTDLNAKKEYMKTIISLVLLVGGIVLIIFGVNASDSLGSDISRFFNGAPTDKAIWMLIGGAVATVAGLSGLTFKAK